MVFDFSSHIETISCPRAGKINWTNDAFQLISPPLFLSITKKDTNASRKLTVLYPISRKSNTDFHQPQFFRVEANANIKLDTTVLTARQTKPLSIEDSKGQLFCATDVEPGCTIVLVLIPKINHSLFLTGKEKSRLTADVSLTIAPELAEDKPFELVSKLVPVPVESTLKYLNKNQLDLKWLSPIIQFTNARRIAFPISLEFSKTVSKAAKVFVMQKIPNENEWVQQECKIQRGDGKLVVQTKTISHLIVIIANQQLDKEILETIPNQVLAFSQSKFSLHNLLPISSAKYQPRVSAA